MQGSKMGVKSDLGGTCHNDKPGLNDGDDGGIGMRMRRGKPVGGRDLPQ